MYSNEAEIGFQRVIPFFFFFYPSLAQCLVLDYLFLHFTTYYDNTLCALRFSYLVKRKKGFFFNISKNKRTKSMCARSATIKIEMCLRMLTGSSAMLVMMMTMMSHSIGFFPSSKTLLHWNRMHVVKHCPSVCLSVW